MPTLSKESYLIDEWSYNNFLMEEGLPDEIIGTKGWDWWLRTPGGGNENAMVVSQYGYANVYNYDWVDNSHTGIRPAIYIEIKQDSK